MALALARRQGVTFFELRLQSTISTCIEFCNFRSPRPASRSQVLVPALERRLEDINAQLDVPITININRAPAA